MIHDYIFLGTDLQRKAVGRFGGAVWRHSCCGYFILAGADTRSIAHPKTISCGFPQNDRQRQLASWLKCFVPLRVIAPRSLRIVAFYIKLGVIIDAVCGV